MLYWGILFTSIFLFTVFTSVYLLNRVRKNKYMVKTPVSYTHLTLPTILRV